MASKYKVVATPGFAIRGPDGKWRAIWEQDGIQKVKVFGRDERERMFADQYAHLMETYHNPD